MPRHGNGNGEYLFHDYHFFSVQENQLERLRQAIESADAARIQTGSVEEVAGLFVQQFRLDVPELTEGAISVDVEEAQVDVSGDPMRAFIYGDSRGGGSHLVPGIRATYFVPFSGDKGLLKVQPNTYTTVIPFADVRGNELRFVFERPDQNVGETKKALEGELSLVKQYLGWLRDNANTFNSSLPNLARDHVTRRRTRLGELQRGTDTLGIAIRRPGGSTAPVAERVARVPSAATVPVASASKIYDVALTFAGEDRIYVEKVANGLKTAGVDVFYDEFEKANLWGKNLVDHLAEIYQNKSRYVVMFISENYVKKAWPQHERQHAQARALVAKDEYILPARFDDTEVPGMTNTVGHVALRTTSPQELVDLILKKLGKK